MQNRKTIGEYEILSELGRGGMGIVFRARQPSLDREVALKIVNLDANHDSDLMRQRMKRETRILLRLQHPNLVRILDGNWDHDPPYMVFEFLPGCRDLVSHLAAGGPDRLTAKHWIIQIARGLDYLHREGIIHRDVKPGNVLVDRAGIPRIIDFGLSRHTSANDTRLTNQGETVGSLQYMAPEQLTSPDVDLRADIYSFGLVAHELIARRFVFGGRGFGQVSLAQRLVGNIPALEKAAPGIEPEWVEAIAACCAPEVTKRTASLAQFLQQVGGFENPGRGLLPAIPLSEQPTEPRPVRARDLASPPPRVRDPTATIPGGTSLELPSSDEFASGAAASVPVIDSSLPSEPAMGSPAPVPAPRRVLAGVALLSGALGLALAVFFMTRAGERVPPRYGPTPLPGRPASPLERLEEAAQRLSLSPRVSLMRLKEAIRAAGPAAGVTEVLKEWGLHDLLANPILAFGDDEPDTPGSFRRDVALLKISYLDVFARSHRIPWPLERPVEEMISPRFRQQRLPRGDGWSFRCLERQTACVHENRPLVIPFEVSSPGQLDAAMISCAGLNLYPEFIIWLELNDGHRFCLTSSKIPPFLPPNPVEVADREALAAAAQEDACIQWRAPHTMLEQDCVGIITRGIPPAWLVPGTNRLSVHVLEVFGQRHINGPSVWRFALAEHRRSPGRPAPSPSASPEAH